MIKNISSLIFFKIFKRFFILQVLALLLIFFSALNVSTNALKDFHAESLKKYIRDYVTNNTSNFPESDQICKFLSDESLFLLVIDGTRKIECKSSQYSTSQAKDILTSFQRLKINDYSFNRSRITNNYNFYHYFSTDHNDGSYSVYYVSSAQKLKGILKETTKKHVIILISVILLFTVLSILVSLKLSSPIRSIIGKITSYTDREDEDSIVEKLHVENLTEWEVIESSFTRTQNSAQKFSQSLNLEIKKFQELLDAIPDPIFSIDQEGTVLFANSSFLTQIATTSSSHTDYIGVYFLDIARHYELKKYLDGVIILKKNSDPLEISIDKDGQTRSFLVKANKLENSTSEVSKYVCIFSDITKIKLAEKMRVDFVGNVSHEIRTPLTSIKGYVQTLESIMTEEEKEGKVQIFKVIENSCERLTNLFNDLLSLSIIDSQSEVHREVVPLRDLTEQIISNSLSIYSKVDVKVHTEYLIEEFLTDTALIENILQNLVSNSFKYMGKPGNIHISWSKTDTHTKLIVRDDGEGIPIHHLPRVFERFYRVDQARERNTDESIYSGSGLGLSIVKSSVNKLGGQISTESKTNEGTQFTIIFPH